MSMNIKLPKIEKNFLKKIFYLKLVNFEALLSI